MFNLNICRLCKNTDNLMDLNIIDGGINLYYKIIFCLDLKLHSEDGLPTLICKHCKGKVKKFYKFKQNCLKTDSELRVHKESKINIENNNGEFGSHLEDLKINCYDVEVEYVKKAETVSFDSEENAENDQSSIQCELCGSMFNAKTEYRKHLSSHGETRLYQCKFCHKRFTRSESNNIHMRSHLGIKPFICEVCGQSSTKKQDLIRHMKIHTDEKNHVCMTCGRGFKRSGDLSSHMRTHTGVRPYKCSICEKDYTSHSGLRKHLKTHKHINLR